MVILAVELRQLCLEVCAYASKDGAQVVKHFLCEHAAPVFCDKDQMHMKRKYAVPTSTNIVVFYHRPSMIQA